MKRPSIPKRITRKRSDKTHHPQPGRRDFDTTVKEATQSMPSYRQRFSRFIHIKTISDTSDFIGKTIARPNPLLFGAVVSFAATLTLYIVSKNLGYSLSGFESIGAFIIGWLAGAVYDLLVHVLRKK